MVFIVHIEGVGEVLWLAIDVRPQRHSLTVHFLKKKKKRAIKKKFSYATCRSLDWHNGTCLFHSLLFTVVKECTKQAAVEVIQDGDEEELIKLKGSGKLRTHYKDSHSEFQKISIHFMAIHIHRNLAQR